MKPFIAAVIGGRLYRFRLTMGIIIEFEQLTEKMLSTTDLNTDAESVSTLLWLMIRREDRAIAFEDSVQMFLSMGPEARMEALLAVRKAIKNSYIEKPDSGEKKEPEFFDFTEYITIAASIGIRQDELWELTLAEFYHIQNEYTKNQRRSRNDLFTQAWYSAFFPYVDKKTLSDYLVDIDNVPTKKEQAPDAMFAMINLLNAAFGGEVVCV